MPVKLIKLTRSDYRTAAWSGGTTTQLAIFPPEARYADRDFLWRVSSASVELEESDFTPLPDYERFIATLQGEIVLTHNGGAPIRFRPFEVHAFSGADATHSKGRCTDFNLMLRRGRVTGSMEALHLSEKELHLPMPSDNEQQLLYCAAGTGIVCPSSKSDGSKDTIKLTEGEALLLTGPAALTLTGPAVLIVCRMINL